MVGANGEPILVLDSDGYVIFEGSEDHPTLDALFSDPSLPKMYGPTGGSQAVQGSLFGWSYSPGSFFDMIVESFAGTHDMFGGQLPGFYDAEGNAPRGRSDFMDKVTNGWAVTAVPLSAPFALSDLMPSEWVQILFSAGH